MIRLLKWLHFKLETILVHHVEDFDYNEVLRAERDLKAVQMETLHHLANELMDENVRLEKKLNHTTVDMAMYKSLYKYEKGEMNDEQDAKDRVRH